MPRGGAQAADELRHGRDVAPVRAQRVHDRGAHNDTRRARPRNRAPPGGVRADPIVPLPPAGGGGPAIGPPSPPPKTWLAYAMATSGTSGRASATASTSPIDRSSEAPARSATVEARWIVAPSASGS